MAPGKLALLYSKEVQESLALTKALSRCTRPPEGAAKQLRHEVKKTIKSRKQLNQFRTIYSTNNWILQIKNTKICMAFTPQNIPVWADRVLGHADCGFLHTPIQQPSDLILWRDDETILHYCSAEGEAVGLKLRGVAGAIVYINFYCALIHKILHFKKILK